MGGSVPAAESDDEEAPLRDGPPSPSARDPLRAFRLQYALASLALGAAVGVVALACACALAPRAAGVAEATGAWRVLGAAARSGVAGGASMLLNVFAFMWLRTTVNYQQAHESVGAAAALQRLYAEGGVPRFYRGLLPALVQGPLCRFGDTAANAGVAALLPARWFASADRHALAITLSAAALSAAWRLLIAPIDTLKTTLQVSGAAAARRLRRKTERHGPCVLWDGAYGGAAASAIGYVPWFLTYNVLDARLPTPHARLGYVLRHALLGLCASVASDIASNGARVVKVVKQTSAAQITYGAALRRVVRADGAGGLCRGLGTKLVANALQACAFSVGWRLLRDAMA